MNHREAQELLSLYVIGALDAASVRGVEQHLEEGCDDCEAELRELRQVMEALPAAFAQRGADPSVKQRLMQRVQDDGVAPAAVQSRRKWALPAALAAAILLGVGLISYVNVTQQARQSIARADEIQNLLEAEQAQLVQRESELSRTRDALRAEQAKLAALEERAAAYQTQLAQQEARARAREQALARARRSLAAQQQSQVLIDKTIATLRGELDAIRASYSQTQNELEQLRRTLEAQRTTLAVSTRRVADLEAALAERESVMRLLASPGLALSALAPVQEDIPAEGHVLRNTRTDAWLFYTFGLPAPPAGKVYQMWFITENEGPVSAGLFTPDADGRGVLLTSSPRPGAGAVGAMAATLEPFGGVPKPTGTMYLQGAL